MDLTWALARLSPVKLFKEEDQRGSENEETIHQTIPGWSGFNSLVFLETTLPTVIGYCPMINGSSTEFSTIYTVIKKAQNMCTSLSQKDVVITFDQAIYSKAKQIMWKYPGVSRHPHSPRCFSHRFEFPSSFRKGIPGFRYWRSFDWVWYLRARNCDIPYEWKVIQLWSQGTQAHHGGIISLNVAGIYSLA